MTYVTFHNEVYRAQGHRPRKVRPHTAVPRALVRSPTRFRCSPVPNTSKIVDKIFETPDVSLTALGNEHLTRTRPNTTGGSKCDKYVHSPRYMYADCSTDNKPNAISEAAEERKLRRASASIRRKIQKLRNAKLQIDGNEFVSAQNSETKSTIDRRRSFFFKDKLKRKVVIKDENEEMSEEERKMKKEKIRLRHMRMSKLIWWFRVMGKVCELARDMRKLSMAITQKATSHAFLYNACGYGDQALFFDKSQFSRQKTMLFPIWAQKLALQDVDVRSNEDINQIRGLMLMMKTFREKYTEDMQYKMAKVAMYINCEKNRVILRQGHWGLNFYFVYSGSVFVQKEVCDPQTGESRAQIENIIRAGESFGEIAILGDGKRTASIICREPTEVFQIDKDTFLEICPEIFEAELDQKMDFAKNFEIFKSWEEEKLKRLCFLSQDTYIPHGKVIEADWSKTSYAYFVMQGRISLMRGFSVGSIRKRRDVTLTAMMDKLLFIPDPRSDAFGGLSDVRYASIGALQVDSHSDLRVLLNDKKTLVDKLAMVSEGTKVLRVEYRLLKLLGPMLSMEDYLRKRYKPFKVPTDVELCQEYAEEMNWNTFKAKTLRYLGVSKEQKNAAMIPATSKGSTGWARWPGSGVRRTSGTTYNSPADRNEQVAEFLVRRGQALTEKKSVRNRFVRRDTIGLPIEIRRTSLFPKSRIQKQILRTEADRIVTNDRRFVLVPDREKFSATLARQALGNK